MISRRCGLTMLRSELAEHEQRSAASHLAIARHDFKVWCAAAANAG